MEIKSKMVLEKASVSMLMRRFSVPCAIALLAVSLNNIVDRIFVANFNGLEFNGNTAIQSYSRSRQPHWSVPKTIFSC